MPGHNMLNLDSFLYKDYLVYVVDDDPFIADLMGMIVKHTGAQAKTFTTATKALESFGREHIKPDLLITDYEMGKMNGVELIFECCKVNPRLKTIMISGSVAFDEIQNTPARIDKFLPKPFSTNELIDSVKSLLAAEKFNIARLSKDSERPAERSNDKPNSD